MLKKRKRRQRTVFEVIPLIDVMMILCLFFSIMAFLPQVQNSIEAELPTASQEVEAKEAIIVSVNKSGSIFIQEKPVTKNELIAELKIQLKEDKASPLLLAADKDLKYADVVAILDIMKRTGASQVGMVTEIE